MTYLFDTSHQDLEFAIGLDNYAFVTSLIYMAMDVLVFVQLASYPIAQPPTD